MPTGTQSQIFSLSVYLAVKSVLICHLPNFGSLDGFTLLAFLTKGLWSKSNSRKSESGSSIG